MAHFPGKAHARRRKKAEGGVYGETAYRCLLALARRKRLSPQLRLVARLGPVQLRFRIGQFGLPRKMLLDNVRPALPGSGSGFRSAVLHGARLVLSTSVQQRGLWPRG
jgi:hypothetical protein